MADPVRRLIHLGGAVAVGVPVGDKIVQVTREGTPYFDVPAEAADGLLHHPGVWREWNGEIPDDLTPEVLARLGATLPGEERSGKTGRLVS